MTKVSMTVNGKAVSADVDPRTLLVHFVRDNLRLTGTHVGCDTSQCGACVVHVDGKSVKACSASGVVAPVRATSFQRSSKRCARRAASWPDRASSCVAAPTPAAAESPTISSRRGGPCPDRPSRGPGGSGSTGVTRRTWRPCNSSKGPSTMVAARCFTGRRPPARDNHFDSTLWPSDAGLCGICS